MYQALQLPRTFEQGPKIKVTQDVTIIMSTHQHVDFQHRLLVGSFPTAQSACKHYGMITNQLGWICFKPLILEACCSSISPLICYEFRFLMYITFPHNSPKTGAHLTQNCSTKRKKWKLSPLGGRCNYERKVKVWNVKGSMCIASQDARLTLGFFSHCTSVPKRVWDHSCVS